VCGIFVRVEPKKSSTNEAVRKDQKSINLIANRGPDFQTHKLTSFGSVGFTRLAIREINTGHQPYTGFDNQFISIINGEIYNVEELTTLLINSNSKLEMPKSDIHVAALFLMEFGMTSISKIKGMFAGVLINPHSSEISLFRDRVGEKPLFYQLGIDKLIVSSSISSIAVQNETNFLNLNSESLIKGFPENDSTHLEGIFSVLPAQVVTINYENWNVSTFKYWEWNSVKKSSHSYNESLSDLEVEIEKSVILQLQSDVPLGVLLSGGIDSGIVNYFAGKNYNGQILSFSLGSTIKAFDESLLALKNAKHAKTELIVFKKSPEQLAEVIPELVMKMDFPIFDPSCIAMFSLTKEVSKFQKVVLSGDGGDELFQGYKLFRYLRIAELGLTFPRTTSYLIEKYINMHIESNALEYQNKIFLANKFLSCLKNSNLPFPFTALSPFGGTKLLDDLNINKSLKGKKINNVSGAGELQNYYRNEILPKVYLAKSDSMSMANSVEVRAPLLDPDVISSANYLMSNHYKESTNKNALKRLGAKILPSEVVRGKKHGFAVPLGLIFRYVSEPIWELEDLGIKSQDAKGIWKLMLKGNSHLDHAVWALYILQMTKNKLTEFQYW